MTSTAQDLIQKHRLTVGDYHRMGAAGILREDARVELIEGEIIDMSPIGSTHSGTVIRLNRLFQLAFSHAAVLSVHNPIILNTHSEPEPDLTLLRPREDFYTNSHPRPEDVLLLVEVCESSVRSRDQASLICPAPHPGSVAGRRGAPAVEPVPRT